MGFMSLLQVGAPLIFSIFISTIFYLIFLKKYKKLLIYLAATLLASGVVGKILAILMSRSFHADAWAGEGGLFGAVITSLYFMAFIVLAVIFASLIVVMRAKKEVASEGKIVTRSWLLTFFSLYFLVVGLDLFRAELNFFFVEPESRQMVMDGRAIIKLVSALPIITLFLSSITCVGLLKLKDWARYFAVYEGAIKIYSFIILGLRLYVDNNWYMNFGLIEGLIISIPSIIAVLRIYYLFNKNVAPSFKEKAC